MERAKANKKSYRSMTEFEKEFLPNTFQNKAKKEQKKEPGSFGSELAMKFIEDVKKKLSK